MAGLTDPALRLALAERESYRLCLCAALDQLHAQHRELERLREEKAEMVALWARCARAAFGEQR
jgi:hypothetical protein